MEKAYIFLAEGFEEIEGLTVVDLLRRAKIEIEMIAIGEDMNVTGSHGICVKADGLFSETDFQDGTLFILPGGMPGTKYLGAHDGLCALLKEAKAAGKRVAAICAAPSVLGQNGLLDGEFAVCYPGFEEQLLDAKVLQEEVAVSGNVITSRGMGTAIPFALKLIGILKGEEEAKRLSDSIIYRLS